jgi:hypothetical protein
MTLSFQGPLGKWAKIKFEYLIFRRLRDKEIERLHVTISQSLYLSISDSLCRRFVSLNAGMLTVMPPVGGASQAPAQFA